MPPVHDDLTPPTLGQVLLAPRSIALFGASDDVTKTSSRPLQYLRRAGYLGTIYPINPRRPTVLGEKAWPSLSALPTVPDHVFILTPTADAGRPWSVSPPRGAPRVPGPPLCR